MMKSATIILFCLGAMTCRSSHGQNTNKPADAWNVTDGIRHIDLKLDMPGGLGPVSMSEQFTLYSVQLPVGGGRSSEKRPLTDVSTLGLQVWLLKSDGTAVQPREKPSFIGIGNGGWDTDYMTYSFSKVPSNELAGIVLQVKGKLYCQAINTNMIGPADTPLNAVCGRWQSERGDSYEFTSDGTYEHWQQVPPVSKLAQAEDVDASAKTDLSNGNFLVNHDFLVLIPNEGTSGTNKYYVIKDREDNKKGKFFTKGYSLVMTRSDGSEHRYELVYR